MKHLSLITTINKINIADFFDQVVTAWMNYTFPDLIIFTNDINGKILHSTGKVQLVNTMIQILRRRHIEKLKVGGEQAFSYLHGEQFTVEHLMTNMINFVCIPS